MDIFARYMQLTNVIPKKLVWAILFSHFRWQSGEKTRFSRKLRFIELRSRENRVKQYGIHNGFINITSPDHFIYTFTHLKRSL